MPSKNVVLNSFQRVEYVDRVTNRTALSTWRHHHKMLEGNFPVYVHTTIRLIMYTVTAKSHANFDRPTMTVTNNTHNSASKSHIINNVKPMALSGSTNSHRNTQSILKS